MLWKYLSVNLTIVCIFISIISFSSICALTSRASQFLSNSTRCRDGEVIKIGYLTNVHGQDRERQGHIISGAMVYAVEMVNSNKSLPGNRRLELMFNDTRGQTLQATAALLDQLRNGASAFFGPEDSCYVEATVAASQNLPLISYKCSDARVSSRFPNSTFARTVPQDSQVVQSVLALLRYYKWMKFSVISSPRYSLVADRLVKKAKTERFTVLAHRTYDDVLECCNKKLPCCNAGVANIFHEVAKLTRIWVFFGYMRDLHELLMTLHVKNLLRNGEHVIIYIDFDPYSYVASTKYTSHPYVAELDKNKLLEAARSLLVIVPSPPRGANYETFEAKVREYNTKDPFNFPNPWHDRQRHITMYASYLYDAVMLYAKALASVLNDGLCPANGTEIIRRFINRKRYRSVTGAFMNINSDGEVEGNYTLLALRSISQSDQSINEAVRNKEEMAMLPVGRFEYEEATNETIFQLQSDINWIGGDPPFDEPPCGFDGKICEAPPDSRREIIAGILAGLFFTATVITAVTYRNWKYEKEIAGLLWQIHLKDLSIYTGTLPSYGSRMSLATQGSLESRFYAQTFTQTATYKGTIVAMKELRFARRSLDLPRETKKEMKLMKEIHQDNINPFIGAYIEQNCVYIVTEYCSKGSLQDILENKDVKLDDMFIASLVFDLLSGLIYLHGSDLKVHGNVKSSNCLVTSRWVLKLTDYGLQQLRTSADAESSSSTNTNHHRKLLWTAPELLSCPSLRVTQKGDVYSFAIILHEIFVREGPFGIYSECCKFTEKEIIHLVKSAKNCDEAFRPDLSSLHCQDYVMDTIKECWAQRPESRPDFHTVKQKLKKLRQGLKPNIMDNMIAMMEKYANNLEELVEERTALLAEEKKKTEALLHRMLPKSVAAELIKGEAVVPEAFDAVTVFFSDIVGFTSMSAESTPMEVVTFLNELYTLFDSIIKHYDVYKVETIGDAYMVVSGLPIRNGDAHCTEIASMALELLDSVRTFKIKHRVDQTLQLRIGIHTGPVVAGVVGTTMPRYCLFGDTVNTASRMESNGEALKIHISPQCRDYLERHGGYHIEERGLVEMKGKGKVLTYWLIKHTDGTRPRRDDELSEPSPLFESLHVTIDGKRSRSPKIATSVSRRGSTITFKGNEGIPIHRVPTFLKLQARDSCSSVGKNNSPRLQRKILRNRIGNPSNSESDHGGKGSQLRLNRSKASLYDSRHSLLNIEEPLHEDRISEEPGEHETGIMYTQDQRPDPDFVPVVCGSERVRKESRMPLLRAFSTSSLEKSETSQKKWNSCLDLAHGRNRRRLNTQPTNESSDVQFSRGLKHNTSFKHWIASLFRNRRILGAKYINGDNPKTPIENGLTIDAEEANEASLWQPLRNYEQNKESAL